ncbi:kinetochore component CENP-S-domain-containing protein [Protomyces lactucae-debilis]|uniref:Kinetochore component CENP-S-domain-containing protein n=1 Tax=Protomyces lactucae-debilis TaxID=2754530 RepID=A0A1Y2FP17_PROLT|nr:kinetochore component CENP-S-domain-containing protein [Protomyces lactucae-debilis]ORY85752.1 kinetochore component CENP-S-domain-containing protein [Protomyces lactucae-debilis]
MPDIEEQLQSALWLSVGRIADERSIDSEGSVSVSADFIASLTSYVWMQLQNMTLDVEHFAAHRSSQVVETVDVMLCARKNTELLNEMQRLLAEQQAAAEKEARRVA